jgi:hypothetical protein
VIAGTKGPWSSGNWDRSITVAPGDMRFVEVDRPPVTPVCTIQEAGTDAGRAAGVLACSRALQPQ